MRWTQKPRDRKVPQSHSVSVEIAEKEAMNICIGKSIQSTFKDGCYVHYVGQLGNF